MGSAKALLRDSTGTSWLELATTLLLNAGCETVFVVLGEEATLAQRLLPEDPRIVPVINPRFADGIAHSLVAGLTAVANTSAVATMITLLDLPRMPASVIERVLQPRQETSPAVPTPSVPTLAVPTSSVPTLSVPTLSAPTPQSLRRAVYNGAPGHPVLIGRDHWDALAKSLQGDSGAREYLIEHRAQEVECSDLFDGRDSDTPESLTPPSRPRSSPQPADGSTGSLAR